MTPSTIPHTKTVIEYLNAAGIEGIDSISFEVADNLEVGRLHPMNLIEHANRLNVEGAEAVVLSACVQMPSLPVSAADRRNQGIKQNSRAGRIV